jgi:hypothetical protein
MRTQQDVRQSEQSDQWLDLQFLLNLGKALESVCEFVLRVRCRNLGTDPGFALRNYRIGETDNVNTFLQHGVRKSRRQPRVA